MAKYKVACSPDYWKRKMPAKAKPRPQLNNLVHVEPATLVGDVDGKRHVRSPRHFDNTPSRGFSENVEENYLDAFLPEVTNLFEAKDFVSKFNHQHLRRNITVASNAKVDYLFTLEKYNLCANCQLPIRVKKSRLTNKGEHRVRAKTGRFRKMRRPILKDGIIVGWKEVKQFTHSTGSDVIYADIPEHYEVRVRPDTIDKKYQKLEYFLVPEQRIFNLQCRCFRRTERGGK